MLLPKYRVLWTWDFGAYWDHTKFSREWGSSGRNNRRDVFLGDYKRMVDYASRHHFNGIVIWGAVRAHDNGFEQLRELVKYGREKGVRILPGVSAFSYGGICYDSRDSLRGSLDRQMPYHPYSISGWLSRHPEYSAIAPDGKPYPYGPYSMLACPSRRENVEWFREGLDWLYDEFDVDGIQVEVGDYDVCHCPLCEERRRGKRISSSVEAAFSVSDMITTYTAANEVSHKHKPDSWVICETYSSFGKKSDLPEIKATWPAMSTEDRELLKSLPSESILQWGIDKLVGPYATHIWQDEIYTPTGENIARIHAGSQWAYNGPADYATGLVWDMVKNCRTHGINGVSIFGEESPFSPPNEANYLAFEEAAGLGRDNPECDEALFYSQTLDPLYGGSGFAYAWRDLYARGCMLLKGDTPMERKVNSAQPLENLTTDADYGKKVAIMSREERVRALEGYFAQARSISRGLSGDAAGRWSWLEGKLCDFIYTLKTISK